MKLPNEHKQVSYGVANGASFWCRTKKAGAYRKAPCFYTFKNEREATASAKRIVGGYVVRRVVTTSYEVDK